jgi:cytochrome c-type biogenesis protein CcmH/NrfG
MNTDRIKMLEQFLRVDPTDPFNLYALALEFKNQDSKRTEELFDQLLEQHPNYLPTYYIAGNFFADKSNPEKGLMVLRKGLELALEQKDKSAARELRAAIENWED